MEIREGIAYCTLNRLGPEFENHSGFFWDPYMEVAKKILREIEALSNAGGSWNRWESEGTLRKCLWEITWEPAFEPSPPPPEPSTSQTLETLQLLGILKTLRTLQTAQPACPHARNPQPQTTSKPPTPSLSPISDRSPKP